MADFYQALGFTKTYRQTRPNPYLTMRRGEVELHFFGMEGFEPADSYGSCLLLVPDTGALYAEFAAGLKERYGKVPAAGIPRVTRPRVRKNSGRTAGFTVVDPGGNWVRIFAEADGATDPGESSDMVSTQRSKLAKALENAVVLGESKGDIAQAIRILDANLGRDAPDEDRVQALIYRAELAERTEDSVTLDRIRRKLAELGAPGAY